AKTGTMHSSASPESIRASYAQHAFGHDPKAWHPLTTGGLRHPSKRMATAKETERVHEAGKKMPPPCQGQRGLQKDNPQADPRSGAPRGQHLGHSVRRIESGLMNPAARIGRSMPALERDRSDVFAFFGIEHFHESRRQSELHLRGRSP